MPGVRKNPTQLALDALDRIAQHEKECGARWAAAHTELKALGEQLRVHSQRWERITWILIVAVVGGTVTMILDL